MNKEKFIKPVSCLFCFPLSFSLSLAWAVSLSPTFWRRRAKSKQTRCLPNELTTSHSWQQAWSHNHPSSWVSLVKRKILTQGELCDIKRATHQVSQWKSAPMKKKHLLKDCVNIHTLPLLFLSLRLLLLLLLSSLPAVVSSTVCWAFHVA